MEKFMKSPMYKKETTDEKYHENPFRAVNFKTDSGEELICPNGRKFHLAYRKPVKGNQYGRQEEYYTCEDCSDCPVSYTHLDVYKRQGIWRFRDGYFEE